MSAAFYCSTALGYAIVPIVIGVVCAIVVVLLLPQLQFWWTQAGVSGVLWPSDRAYSEGLGVARDLRMASRGARAAEIADDSCPHCTPPSEPGAS